MSDAPKTPEETKAFLASIGLSPDGKSLASVPTAEVDTPAPAKAKKAKKDKTKEVTTGTPDDPSDIQYDAAWLDGFVLDGSDMKAASDKLFAMHKYPRGDARNKLLHRLNTEFIQRVKRERNPAPRDGFIQGKVKAGKEQRDLAQILADHNIDADGLATLLDALKAAKA